jgi:hypothetical protein
VVEPGDAPPVAARVHVNLAALVQQHGAVARASDTDTEVARLLGGQLIDGFLGETRILVDLNGLARGHFHRIEAASGVALNVAFDDQRNALRGLVAEGDVDEVVEHAAVQVVEGGDHAGGVDIIDLDPIHVFGGGGGLRGGV